MFFFIAAAIVQAFFFVLHFILYETFIYFVVPDLAQGPTFLFWTRIFFFIASIIFVTSTLLVSRTHDIFSRTLYKIAVVWSGTTWFLGFATIPIVLLQLSPAVSEVIFMLAILLSIASIVNSFAIRIKSIELSLDYLPEIWKGKKAVMFADSHLGNMRGRKFIQKITDQILEQKPDIVFIVGDLYDGQATSYNDIISPLRKLTMNAAVPWGVHFVTGNHEEFEDPTRYLLAIKSAGINILDNQTINVGGMTIAGVDYKATEERGNYERILEAMLLGVDKQTPIILLKHVPSNVDVAEKNSVDLCLHGHTHNGQLWPLNFIARKAFKGYEYGLKKFKDMNVLTTSGVGTWGPPQRFFTQSEIISIMFK